MEKEEVWFSISESVFNEIKECAEASGLPKVKGKFLLYVMHNFSPDVLQTDYSYSHARRKMICVKLPKSEIAFISELEKKYDRNTSSLARDMLFTFLKEQKVKFT